MGTDLIPEQNCALKRAFSNSNSDQGRATFSLVGRELANIGTEKLSPDVRERFVAITRYYHSLAKIEQSIADQRPNKKCGS